MAAGEQLEDAADYDLAAATGSSALTKWSDARKAVARRCRRFDP
jgi:hypothetical protein